MLQLKLHFIFTGIYLAICTSVRDLRSFFLLIQFICLFHLQKKITLFPLGLSSMTIIIPLMKSGNPYDEGPSPPFLSSFSPPTPILLSVHFFYTGDWVFWLGAAASILRYNMDQLSRDWFLHWPGVSFLLLHGYFPAVFHPRGMCHNWNTVWVCVVCIYDRKIWVLFSFCLWGDRLPW